MVRAIARSFMDQTRRQAARAKSKRRAVGGIHLSGFIVLNPLANVDWGSGVIRTPAFLDLGARRRIHLSVPYLADGGHVENALAHQSGCAVPAFDNHDKNFIVSSERLISGDYVSPPRRCR